MRSPFDVVSDKSPVPTPLQLVGKFGLVIIASLVVGLVVPGLLAVRGKVFYPQSMKAVVEKKHPEVVRLIEDYDANKVSLQKSVASIDQRIATDPSSATSLAGLKQSYLVDLRKPAPISIQPFYLHLIMYFWPIMYFGLGSVAFILRPSGSPALRFSTKPLLTVVTTMCIYVYTIAPVIFRTQAAKTAEHGRTVFSYSNPDIDLPSHLAQLSNFFVFSFLLAVIWIEWSAWTTRLGEHLDSQDFEDETVNVRGLNELSRDLLRWQVMFLAVSVGFVIYTAIFWDQIIINGDNRFGFEAIDIHLLWLTTVVIISAPLAMRWHRWQIQKIQTVAALLNSNVDADTMKAKLEAIRELQPIGRWNLTASGLTVVVSFAAPLLQALIKKSIIGAELVH